MPGPIAPSPSPRPYQTRLPTGHFIVKTVTTAGAFRSGKRPVHLANALANQCIGMEETDDGLRAIYFHMENP